MSKMLFAALALLSTHAGAQVSEPLSGPYRVQPQPAPRFSRTARPQDFAIEPKSPMLGYRDRNEETADGKIRREMGEHFYVPHLSLTENAHESVTLRSNHGIHGFMVYYTVTP